MARDISNSRDEEINLGIEETNSPEDFERDSKFKIPSDINLSDNKKTILSGFNQRQH